MVQVAKDFPNIKIHINDKDPYMYAFWKLLADGNDKEIGAFYTMVRVKPTVEMFKHLREHKPAISRYEMAHYAVFFNRTAFSGIQTSGPIGGYEQKSKWAIDCRYNASRIIREFEALRTMVRGRLTVANEDVVDFVARMPHGAMYLDPPYYEKGKELYPVFMQPEEHEALAKSLHKRKDWVLSYDMCPEISELYKWADCQSLAARYSIRDKKENWTDKKEYLIVPK